jgi:hypothetical protein
MNQTILICYQSQNEKDFADILLLIENRRKGI